jgi:hypothetical protein
VDVDHQFEVRDLHLGEGLVAQDAGVGDQDVDAAPLVHVLADHQRHAGVVYLCSEEAPRGAILTAGAGAFALSRIVETEGVYLGEGGLSVEEVRDNWGKIIDSAGQQPYFMGGEQSAKFFRKAMEG